ncbi:superoxide dismutase [Halotia branconii]|uniref:superoxide dismutase n=1 Tax=Halotia branconii CENA392 TaxID=1539056 RepID=A0AAJ6PAI7_9CYAN|nr:superoxide dismutase [Halotia branconii]WGV26761.1 superoxide dismutase [Halotia branconii CENA392]
MLITKIRQKVTAFLFTVVLGILLVSCQPVPLAGSQSPTVTPTPTESRPPVASTQNELSANPAKLPPLPYDYGVLGKAIDAETMKLHHDAHHASYVSKLNDALKNYPNLRKKSVEALLKDLNSVPEDIRTKVRNNGGGHVNHTMFWQIMSPQGGGEPKGAIAKEINQTFGSFDDFKKQFNAAGGDRFGSGWVWLVRNPQGKLQITTTANQDSPITDGAYPIMGNDVWEHAYYLRYRNRRGEYLDNWWNVVNWPEIDKRSQLSLQQRG